MALSSVIDIEGESVALLRKLITIPSFSREENGTASAISNFLSGKGIEVKTHFNNVWATNKYFDLKKPGILLNSHHDTVKPNSGYTTHPFTATEKDGKLYGLGSNDAGGALVALLGSFLHFYARNDLNFNIIYAATAEEEISGQHGIESIINALGDVSVAIVGEPTQMKLAIAERGLMVLDCIAEGKAGHAARNEGTNAIYKAIRDIDWFSSYQFKQVSEWLGPVGMNVTVINGGSAHNQVPATCQFVVDIRLNELYTHQQILEEIGRNVSCKFIPRSTRMKPSFIEKENPMVQSALEIGIPLFGSPTMSDMALMPWKAVKIGPGDSARSHSADEFIFIDEIKQGIKTYMQLIETYNRKIKQNETLAESGVKG